MEFIFQDNVKESRFILGLVITMVEKMKTSDFQIKMDNQNISFCMFEHIFCEY